MESDHPSEQQWMEWLYDETDTDTAQLMSVHLQQCSFCREQVSQWQNVMAALDEDTMKDGSLSVPRTAGADGGSTSGTVLRTSLRQWCVLLASIVVAAFAGAWSVSVFGDSGGDQLADVDVLRTELRQFVRQEMEGTSADKDRLVPLIQDESGRIVAAELAGWARQDSARTEQLQQILGEVLRNQLALREDLETLAMEAEAQILQTRRELVRVSMDVIPDGRTGVGLPQDEGAEPF